MGIKIVTDQVVEAAERIEQYNRAIAEDFSSLERTMNHLGYRWEGGVSSLVTQKFTRLARTFPDDRFEALQGVTEFLRAQVATGYEQTEASIVTAASAFK